MLLSLLNKLGLTNTTRRPARPRRSAIPRLEALEDRAAPASFTVTSLANSGAGTLRQAITDANASMDASSTITFQAGLSGNINLSSQLPKLTKNITIDGPGGATISVRGSGSAANPFRLFETDIGKTCSIDDLVLTQGYLGANGDGGAIYNRGTLYLDRVTVMDNDAGRFGGGIYNTGTITITDCDIYSNTAQLGGGIYNNGTAHLLADTDIYVNSATAGGGIYNTLVGDMTLLGGVSIYSNSATTYGGGVHTSGDFEMNGGQIHGNSAGDEGGGIYVTGNNTSSLTNVSITENSSDVGGGFRVQTNALLTLTDCTLSGNTASTQANTAGGAHKGAATFQLNGGTILDPITQF